LRPVIAIKLLVILGFVAERREFFAPIAGPEPQHEAPMAEMIERNGCLGNGRWRSVSTVAAVPSAIRDVLEAIAPSITIGSGCPNASG
jgi:hypothetical protein